MVLIIFYCQKSLWITIYHIKQYFGANTCINLVMTLRRPWNDGKSLFFRKYRHSKTTCRHKKPQVYLNLAMTLKLPWPCKYKVKHPRIGQIWHLLTFDLDTTLIHISRSNAAKWMVNRGFFRKFTDKSSTRYKKPNVIEVHISLTKQIKLATTLTCPWPLISMSYKSE